MTLLSRFVVYPEGESQEIPHHLTINQLVDLNGYPLQLPLQTDKMIAYRVFRMSTEELRGEEIKRYYLELVNRDELRSYLR